MSLKGIAAELGLTAKQLKPMIAGNNQLKRLGFDGDRPCKPLEIKAAFEAHIEQGPILEAEEKTIGIVQGAQGQRWYELVLTGVESHAGR